MQVQVLAGTVVVLLAVLFSALASAAVLHPDDPSRHVLRIALEPISSERVLIPDHVPTRTGLALPEPEQAEGPSQTGQATSFAAPAKTRIANVSTDQQIMPLSFRLTPNFNPGPEGLTVTKQLAHQSGKLADIQIILVDATRIEIERASLSSALAELGLAEAGKRLPETQKLSLETIRRAGLDLRYDAIRDRLVLMN